MGNPCSRPKPVAMRPQDPEMAPAPSAAEKVAYQEVGNPENKSAGGRRCGCSKICGCLCCLLILGCLYVLACFLVAYMSVGRFLDINDKRVEEYCSSAEALTMSNMTENLWWPGCDRVKNMSDFAACKGTCIKMATMQAMGSFNTFNGGMKVSYYSRADGKEVQRIKLTGWWLPAPGHTFSTPRIVLQHGFNANSNSHRQMFAAYQLRKLGYSVLVNNLRDHCYSDDSKDRVVEWGDAYPYDVLGAWDFAVNDTQGIMGGPISPAKVGIMGFSMGAFLTTTVFGLEGRVPAVWVDGPPFKPKNGYAYKLRQEVGFLGTLTGDLAWEFLKMIAKGKGVQLDENTPQKVLGKGPDTLRKIQWVGNKDDTTVSYTNGEQLQKEFEKYPSKYSFNMWTLQGKCNGNDHCEDHVRIPEAYESKLCNFWNTVFGLTNATCPTSAGVPVANQTTI